MEHYLSYAAEQFVWDAFFRDWVLHPTPESDAVWEQWLIENPEKMLVIQQARALVLALQVKESPLSTIELDESVRQIVARATDEHPPIRVGRTGWFSGYRLAAAASVMLMLGLGGWLWSTQKTSLNREQALQEKPAQRFIERRNSTLKPMLVNLSDGSLVVLQPNSKLRFPRVFDPVKREVQLVGDAFFEVSKDPGRPFFVLTDEIVTKVLGTSFSVRAFQNEQGISVKVKTGRVAVFHRSLLTTSESDADQQWEEVVLKAHQQVEYSRKKALMKKSPLVPPTEPERDPVFYQFQFDDTPLPEVLATLENAYGITISYDKNQLKDCPLTARFSDQSLHEMLQFICTALNGSYVMEAGRLVLDVKGCKE